jgi:hypothetical protein
MTHPLDDGVRKALEIEPDALVNAIMGSDLIRLYGIKDTEIARYHARRIAAVYRELAAPLAPESATAKRPTHFICDDIDGHGSKQTVVPCPRCKPVEMADGRQPEYDRIALAEIEAAIAKRARAKEGA